MSSSVIPSAKYSWVGSFERFSNGRTGDRGDLRTWRCRSEAIPPMSRVPEQGRCNSDDGRGPEQGELAGEGPRPGGGAGRWLADDACRVTIHCGHGVREVELLNRSDEAVAVPGERFDEAGVLGGVAQSVTDAIDGAIEAAVEVHDRVVRPDPLLQLFPRQDLARPFQERDQ